MIPDPIGQAALPDGWLDCAKQFTGQRVAAGQVAVELELLNEHIGRKAIIQCSDHPLPGWCLRLAGTADSLVFARQRQAASTAVRPGPGQVVATRRTQVFGTACKATHQAVPGQQVIQYLLGACLGP